MEPPADRLKQERTQTSTSKGFELPLHSQSSPDTPGARRRWISLQSLLVLCIVVNVLWHTGKFYGWYFRETAYSNVQNPAYLIEAKHGAVASENKRCSDIGVDVLKEGGNAVDSAIATTLCIGVVNMFSYVISSPFLLVHLPCDEM